MSQLLVVLPGDRGGLDAVLADSEEVVDGQRCFRAAGDLVLRLPVPSAATVLEVHSHDVPVDGWDRLRDALRADITTAAAFRREQGVTKQDV